MTSTYQDDHHKVSPDPKLDTSALVNLVLPLSKALALKLDLGLRTSQRKVTFADPLRWRCRDMVPATKADLTARSYEFIPISFNAPVFCQNSEGSLDLGINRLGTR